MDVQPNGFLSRLRTFVNVDRQVGSRRRPHQPRRPAGRRHGHALNGFMQFRYIDDHIRAGDEPIGRKQFGYVAQFSPSRRLPQVGVDGSARPGDRFRERAARPRHDDQRQRDAQPDQSSRAGARAEPALAQRRRRGWRVSSACSRRACRACTAPTRSRRSCSSAGSRSTSRPIAIPRSTSTSSSRRAGDFSGSALLAYKLNWQSVMFVGYGDDRELTDAGAPREARPSVLRQGLLRVPALIPGAGLQACATVRQASYGRSAGLQACTGGIMTSWLEQTAKDLRYGSRSLLKNPGLSALAVLSLAAGVMATTRHLQRAACGRPRSVPLQGRRPADERPGDGRHAARLAHRLLGRSVPRDRRPEHRSSTA